MGVVVREFSPNGEYDWSFCAGDISSIFHLLIFCYLIKILHYIYHPSCHKIKSNIIQCKSFCKRIFSNQNTTQPRDDFWSNHASSRKTVFSLSYLLLAHFTLCLLSSINVSPALCMCICVCVCVCVYFQLPVCRISITLSNFVVVCFAELLINYPRTSNRQLHGRVQQRLRGTQRGVFCLS